jgi:hypothetical protein
MAVSRTTARVTSIGGSWSARAMGTLEASCSGRSFPARPYIFNGMVVALPIALIVAFV